MIDSAAVPVGHQMAMDAIRQSLQHERNIAAVAMPEEKAATDFEGKGPSDPVRGAIVDISV